MMLLFLHYQHIYFFNHSAFCHNCTNFVPSVIFAKTRNCAPPSSSVARANPRNQTRVHVQNLIISACPIMPITFTAVEEKSFLRSARTIASVFPDLVMKISTNAGVPHQRSVMVATILKSPVFVSSIIHLSRLKCAHSKQARERKGRNKGRNLICLMQERLTVICTPI